MDQVNKCIKKSSIKSRPTTTIEILFAWVSSSLFSLVELWLLWLFSHEHLILNFGIPLHDVYHLVWVLRPAVNIWNAAYFIKMKEKFAGFRYTFKNDKIEFWEVSFCFQHVWIWLRVFSSITFQNFEINAKFTY